jgi:hypothetical protein
MGYDISYHPVDLDFVHGTLLPALLTGEGLAELEAEAARHAKNRYIANAWGLGVNAACRDAWVAAQERSSPKPAAVGKPGLFARMLGRGAKGSGAPAAPSAAEWILRYESDLHVWGRPYFITAKESAHVSAAIDAWLNAVPENADALARGMVERLAPELLPLVHPDYAAGIPSDEAFLEAVSEPVATCREVLRALEAGERFMSAEGTDIDPADLVGSDFIFTLARIASWFRPGWMDRGKYWPTRALPAVLPEPGDYWQPATQLIAPLLARHPRIQCPLFATIESNYQVGGFVAAKDVPRLRRDVEAARAVLIAGDHPETSWTKLHEAVLDAESRGIAFLEATEIYSGPEGILN